jgi:hypothetical protein
MNTKAPSMTSSTEKIRKVETEQKKFDFLSNLVLVFPKRFPVK